MRAFKANQQRGSWIAKLENGFEELGVDPIDPYVAVVIKDEFCQVDQASGTFTHHPHPEKGQWWSLPTSARWRGLMTSGKPVLMRDGANHETKTAGPKIGFFSIEDFNFNEMACSYRVTAQLGECS